MNQLIVSRKRFWIGVLITLMLLSLATPLVVAQDGGQNPTTQEALAAANVPARDLNELAQRLNGVEEIPVPPTSPERIYQLGDVDQFWVHDDDQVIQIDATLVYMNDVLYMWVQDGYTLDEVALAEAADRFATEVYQPVRDVFGSEWSPGIDGDPRLHILHSANLGVDIAGYFYGESEYSQEAVPASNEREMFFVDVGMINYGVDYYLSILAHEFQHMIHWAVDANEESWLNEGLAELSAYVAGFGPSGFTETFLSDPTVQLIYWPEDDTRPIYGAGFLFSAYILERYGIDATRSLVAEADNGIDSVQDMLDEIGATDPFTGEPMTVESLYTEWSIANYLSDVSLLDGRYGYQDAQLQALGPAEPTLIAQGFPLDLSDVSANQWGSYYYVVPTDGSQQSLRYTFDGNATVSLLPENAHSGQYAYWSNRVDSSDTRLTHEFDLTDLDTATLSFWSWYDIEEGWDFAYVMVSTDGGTTWTTLETPYTTTDNPHKTSYGNGFTSTTEDWVQQTVDLSAYAGQPIWVRFEYITDDATIRNGFLLDDVEIPELGYIADFEQADETWVAEGWARIDNVIDQAFALHVIMINGDGTANVERLWLGGDAQAIQGDILLAKGVEQVIFTVSSFAPITIQPSTFTLQVKAQAQ